MLAVDDFEYPPVQAAWGRHREHGVGIIEHVVAATGEYSAECWVSFTWVTFLERAVLSIKTIF